MKFGSWKKRIIGIGKGNISSEKGNNLLRQLVVKIGQFVVKIDKGKMVVGKRGQLVLNKRENWKWKGENW